MANCKFWDFTLSCDFHYDEHYIKERLKAIASKWVFQREKSDNGYEHFQGRFCLYHKKTLNPVIKLFNIPESHLTPSSKNSTTGSNRQVFSYVMKEDTRVAGPWTDTDKESDIICPEQYRVQLKGWQQELYELLMKELDDKDYRKIHVLVDYKGGIGKTTMALNLTCTGKAEYIPPVNDSKDMLRMCYDLPTSRLYIIDLTRSMNKDKLFGLYSGIEQLKNGYIYDDRYKFQRKFIDTPAVLVLTNTSPDSSYLTSDRWIFHILDENEKLLTFNLDEFNEYIEQ